MKTQTVGPPPHNECMFLASTTRTQTINRLIETLHQILQEAPLRITNKGVAIRSIESNYICCVDIMLERNGFDRYHLNYFQGVIDTGVQVNTLRNKLKGVNSHDSFTMYISKDAPDKLGVCTYDQDRDMSYHHTITLMKLSYREFSIPPLVYDSRVRMESRLLHDTVKYMSVNQADNVYLGFHNGSVVLKSEADNSESVLHIHTNTSKKPKGDEAIKDDESIKETALSGSDSDTDSADSYYEPEAPNEEKQKTKRKRKPILVLNNLSKPKREATKDMPLVKYPIKYLEKFTKAYVLNQWVDIFMIDDGVIVLRYHISVLGTMRFLLAPKEDNVLPWNNKG
jgi:hypothetical protein